MKKLLSFLVVMFLVSATLFAQTKTSRMNTSFVAKAKQTALTGNEMTPENVVPEVIRAFSTTNIGSTYYDAVTNATSRNTITNWNDGTVAAVWTTGQVSSQRGTGYNYYNGNSWFPAPPATERIESVRTGWGVIAPVGNGEIVVSHNGNNGLTICKRATKGTGDWTESTLIGPPHDGDNSSNTVLLWPTIATEGNTVHLFACTDNVEDVLYQGLQTPLLYFKSTDGGSTWSAPQLIGAMTGLNESMADNYMAVAKGGKVALLVIERFSETYYIESSDGGTTWTKHTVYPFVGGNNFDFDTQYFPMTAVTDGTGSIAIGDDGTVHVAFGTYMAARTEENEPGYYTYWAGYDNLFYWNSTMTPLVAFDTTTAETYSGRLGRPNLDGDDTIWFMSGYSFSDYRNNGPITFPSLVAEGGKVYMVYAAAMEAPYLCGATSEYYYGIFATVSNDNGATWDDQNRVSWLSYHPEMYFVDWVSSELYGELFVTMEGECFWPKMAPNSTDGKLSIMWYFDYLPGNVAGFGSATNYVYAMNIDKEDIGVIKKTTEVYQGLWNEEGIKENTLSEMKLFPNPTSNTVTINLFSKDQGAATLTITNLMGQVVYNEIVSLGYGTNQLMVNCSDFISGFYLVNISTQKGSTTQKLIVQ
ncbi:MAG TPA: T9SS type A sorting domain-containing protein [Bacteroidales bacterium]|nr:T9SS type A sorting domain-containing protein [Bacteroidales bacterium]HOH22080.1 T9SS type A sorting domain-containing protein [Bacteroidales bacterium]HPZ03459.1 T9SS type A sorting domain-containing protein [Bacteroidales bacterium]HQB74762.1 T9SS type A sorting domain-containing protein [Bacteroidales bacterium]